ncbi:hypothetical protein LO772_10470 [Yinghuangia sp. ASG 101]|uniref:alpha/beta hydrolase domain-containing protein n=1 Tax=Yinghuangia sp. ASG 101 TaxID=2896848 RepID=UPI001E4F5BCE|nr:alpha/beta hydrolase domain-containing protein [Yinghuangia sp. ASG 101]UGQ13981.1 hypothetical protein LO772_10470 [Yinghuangia sp. ASG 101]
MRRLPLLLVLAGTLAASTSGPALADTRGRSGITAVSVTRAESLGTFGGVAYERLAGTVSGVVAKGEPVAGLRSVAGADGTFRYTSGFELIRPVRPSVRGDVVVEAENRGTPVMLGNLNTFRVPGGAPQDVSYPSGLGSGFLFDDGRSYARVQWQTGISSGVPATAQGVGQVIMRDFGRLLRDGRIGKTRSDLGTYRHRLLIGWSQAAWFVTGFVAEGFNNADGRVFHGALALDAAGNQLAVNAAADHGPQTPYVRPNGVPLTPRQVLRRPKTDPVFVDVAAYTDYYRLRADISRQGRAVDGYHRYDWPAAHAPMPNAAAGAFVFGQFGCNNGRPIPLNPIDSQPYARALLVALEHHIGVHGHRAPMPAEQLFATGAQPTDASLLNGLPGRNVSVPRVDDDGFPTGGVRFPAAELPLGAPEPPVLSPVSTQDINAVCGNFGGWRPYTADVLRQRYGSLDRYLAAYDAAITRLVRQRFLLDTDRQTLLTEATTTWTQAPAHP